MDLERMRVVYNCFIAGGFVVPVLDVLAGAVGGALDLGADADVGADASMDLDAGIGADADFDADLSAEARLLCRFICWLNRSLKKLSKKGRIIRTLRENSPYSKS